MSESIGSVVGPEFDIPDEILSVMPMDPYDQLDLARKITSLAIASRVTKLESEVGRLRQKVHDKDRIVVELEDKVSQLQQAFHETELRLKLTREDNIKLVKERDMLALTTKKLTRDLSKLETFKRQLMQSLNDDNSTQAETVDIGTYDQSLPKSHSAKEQTGQRYSMTPYITPVETPKMTSVSVSPRGYSLAGSPQKSSGPTSPVKSHYDGSGTLSSWFPSSQQSSAATSPSRTRSMPARAPRIDGKEFFRQARSRLSYEQFSAFLANIKELNAQKQSREETLRKAEEIFGNENKDLYVSFQSLLSRNSSN